MNKIKVRKSEAEDVYEIAYRLRTDDLEDLKYSNNTPTFALMQGFFQGCYTYLVDGHPEGMFGCVKINNTTGGLWFLGTDNSMKYKRDWVKLGRLYIGYFLSIYPNLVNIISKKNKSHKRWLQFMGATFYPSDKEGFEIFKIRVDK